MAEACGCACQWMRSNNKWRLSTCCIQTVTWALLSLHVHAILSPWTQASPGPYSAVQTQPVAEVQLLTHAHIHAYTLHTWRKQQRACLSHGVHVACAGCMFVLFTDYTAHDLIPWFHYHAPVSALSSHVIPYSVYCSDRITGWICMYVHSRAVPPCL